MKETSYNMKRESTALRPFMKIVTYSLGLMPDGKTYHGKIPVEFFENFLLYMEADYEIQLVPDKTWGNQYPNGSWSGMVGMVNRSEVDMAMSGFILTPKRYEAVTFTQPFLYDAKRLVTPRPRLESDISGFLKPFTLQVWLCILACLVIMGLAMLCSEFIENRIYNHFPMRTSLARAMIWALKTFTQESSTWLPDRSGGRYLAMTWLLASLVFMSSYSGILTAMLTLPRVNIPVDSLEDLVTQTSIPWKIHKSGFFTSYLQESKDPVFKKTFTGRSGTIKTCSENAKEVLEARFATICYEMTIKRVIWQDFRDTGTCKLYLARGKVFSESKMSLIFQKNSPFFEKANRLIGAMFQSGLIGKWFRNSIPVDMMCFQPPTVDRTNEISPLDIRAMGGSLLLFIGGLCLALVVFIAELLFNSNRD